MNFKTHAPARREGTTLQPNIHSRSVGSLSQGASEVQNSAFLSATARASGLINGSALLGCFDPGRLHLGGLRVPALVSPRTSLLSSLRDGGGLAFRVKFIHTPDEPTAAARRQRRCPHKRPRRSPRLPRLQILEVLHCSNVIVAGIIQENKIHDQQKWLSAKTKYKK